MNREQKYKILGSDVSLEGCLSAANPKGLGAARLRTEAILPQPHKVVNGELAPVSEKQPVGTRSIAANHNDSCRELILDKMRLT